MMLYKIIYGISPKAYKNWVSVHLKYADFSIPSDSYVGFSLSYSLALALALGILFFVLKFSFFLTIIFSMVAFVLLQVILSSILVLTGDGRAKFTEEVLPDVLQLMAANMRSGLTPDRALLASARPEFGPLETEIKRASRRVISGDTLEDSLRGIKERINSKLLDRGIRLIIEGIRKGGELPTLLEQTAEDIRHVKVLLKEVSSYVLMYVIFIFFASAIGAPLLYGVSTYLVETMTKIGSMTQVEGIPTSSQISVEFLRNYALAALTITSLFGSLLIGLIKDGSEKSGLKFIPFLFLLSAGIFFVTKMLIAKMLPISLV